MAQETKTPSSAPKTHPAAPLFQAVRTVLSEADQQADRWLEYGIAQAGEGAKLIHAARGQAIAAATATLDTVEKLTGAALDAGGVFTRPFGGASA